MPLETAGLDDRDAALAHAIHDGAVRRWWTLQALISPFLGRPFLELEPRLRGALLGGAAQLVLLDRVPPHAAIDETVEWAKRSIRPGAGGLVNAVLRRVSELVGPERAWRDRWTMERDEIPLTDGRALALRDPALPEDRLERLSAATSVPRSLLEAWGGAFGVPKARSIAVQSLLHAPVILNIRHAERPVPGLEPHERPGFALLPGGGGAVSGTIGGRGDVWVQDPASAEAVESVRDLSPGLIVDVCAGMGTKTRQLARVFPEAEIVASDVDRDRLATLRGVFEGHARVRVVEAGALLETCLGRADLILLDVPCSNTGVLARRPEAKYRAATAQGERLAQTQRQIIADAIRLLGAKGSMLYSTCSLLHEENGAQAAWAKRWHGFRIERERTTTPAGEPGGPISAYHDGSYSVLMRRG